MNLIVVVAALTIILLLMYRMAMERNMQRLQAYIAAEHAYRYPGDEGIWIKTGTGIKSFRLCDRCVNDIMNHTTTNAPPPV